MSELKACPFCGKEAKTFEWETVDGKQTFAQCVNNCCFMSEEDGVRIKIWNTRPLEDALTAENARLREALRDLLSLVEEHGDKVIMAHATKLLGIKSALTPIVGDHQDTGGEK